MLPFLDAGFLEIGKFGGYFVFLDLVTGEVVHIYHEAVYDMSIVDGVDVSDCFSKDTGEIYYAYEDDSDNDENIPIIYLASDFLDFMKLLMK